MIEAQAIVELPVPNLVLRDPHLSQWASKRVVEPSLSQLLPSADKTQLYDAAGPDCRGGCRHLPTFPKIWATKIRWSAVNWADMASKPSPV